MARKQDKKQTYVCHPDEISDEELYHLIYEGAPRFRKNRSEIFRMVKKWRELIDAAIEAGFILEFRQNVITDGMFSRRKDKNGNTERFTYWITRYSVRTYLVDHPRSGTGTLHRGREPDEDWTHEQFLRELKKQTGPGQGLRAHLNCGYKTIEQKNRNEKRFRRDRNE